MDQLSGTVPNSNILAHGQSICSHVVVAVQKKHDQHEYLQLSPLLGNARNAPIPPSLQPVPWQASQVNNNAQESN